MQFNIPIQEIQIRTYLSEYKAKTKIRDQEIARMVGISRQKYSDFMHEKPVGVHVQSILQDWYVTHVLCDKNLLLRLICNYYFKDISDTKYHPSMLERSMALTNELMDFFNILESLNKINPEKTIIARNEFIDKVTQSIKAINSKYK